MFTIMNCLNCGASVNENQIYCSVCGQQTNTRRLKFRHIMGEIVHAFTHADKGFFYLIKELAIRPGSVAREYIEGKRKKYFNPFNFLLIVAAVYAFFTIHFHVLDPYDANPVSRFLSHYSNLILILGTPLLSFFSWLFFKNSKMNFSESLVFNAFLIGEINLFYDLIVAPLVLAFKPYYAVFIGIYILIWVCYYCWACMYFFQQPALSSVIKGILIIVLYQFFVGFIAYGIYYLVVTLKR
jgi:hypothetical protein